MKAFVVFQFTPAKKVAIKITPSLSISFYGGQEKRFLGREGGGGWSEREDIIGGSSHFIINLVYIVFFNARARARPKI